jgi:hypothetical protein
MFTTSYRTQTNPQQNPAYQQQRNPPQQPQQDTRGESFMQRQRRLGALPSQPPQTGGVSAAGPAQQPQQAAPAASHTPVTSDGRISQQAPPQAVNRDRNQVAPPAAPRPTANSGASMAGGPMMNNTAGPDRGTGMSAAGSEQNMGGADRNGGGMVAAGPQVNNEMAPGGPDRSGGQQPPAQGVPQQAYQSRSVADLYQNILGRAPDSRGAAHWQSQFGPTIEPGEIEQFYQAAQAELGQRGPQQAPQAPPGRPGPPPGPGQQPAGPAAPQAPPAAPTGGYATYQGQQFAQFQGPDQAAMNQQQNALLQQLLQNPMSVNADQLKAAQNQESLLMQKQAEMQMRQNAAASGRDPNSGMLQGQLSLLGQQTRDSLLNSNRNIDIQAAQQRQQDMINALNASEGLAQGQLGRSAQSYNTTLAGQQANSDQRFREYQSTLAAQQQAEQQRQFGMSNDLAQQGVRLNQQQLQENARQFNQNFGLNSLQFLTGNQQWAQQFAEGQRQFNNNQAFNYQQAGNSNNNSLMSYLMGMLG